MTDGPSPNAQTALSRMLGRSVLPMLVGIAMTLGTAHANATDLQVVSEPATARVLTDLAPRIEHLTKRRLVVTVVPAEAMTRRLTGTDPFDAIVVYEPDAVALLENNRLVDRLFCIGWTQQGRERTPIYAAVSRETTDPVAAQRLVAFLSSFQGLMALTAHGLEGTPNE